MHVHVLQIDVIMYISSINISYLDSSWDKSLPASSIVSNVVFPLRPSTVSMISSTGNCV